MFASDEDSTESTKLTLFDINRLDELEIGDFFDGEKGNFRILRYKDDYNVMLFNSKTKQEFSTHITKKDVIEFLNK